MSELLTLLGSPDGDSIYEATIKDALEKRILIINQEINDDIMENYIYQILRWNLEDINIPKEKRKPIKLYINSPGGDCIIGFSLVDVIKNSETKVIGIGFGCVASMAYHLFICCHERVAFPNTVLLMHDGEVTISNSSSKAKGTMKFIDNMELRTKNHVLEHTKITEEHYDKYYDAEYYMYANDRGKELGCVDKIVGEDVDMSYIL